MRDESHHQVHVLTGPVQGGKTSLLAEQAALLKHGGIKVMGILSPGVISEGRRTEFQLENIHTGQRIPMGREKEQKGWMKYRRFYFNPEAFRKGRAWIEQAVTEQADLLLIDEVGPLELEGMGWSGILDSLRNESGIRQVWTVRESLVPEVCRRWKIIENQVYTTDSMDVLLKKWQI